MPRGPRRKPRPMKIIGKEIGTRSTIPDASADAISTSARTPRPSVSCIGELPPRLPMRGPRARWIAQARRSVPGSAMSQGPMVGAGSTHMEPALHPPPLPPPGTPPATQGEGLSAHLVAGDCRIGQAGAQARAGRYGDASLGVDPERLGQEEIAPLDRPAGWIEWELKEWPGTHAGGDVQVGKE